MTAVIEQAAAAAGADATPSKVMAELEKLARDPKPTGPLKGVTSGGVQYHDGGQVRTLTKDALRDRLRRAKARVNTR